MEITKMKSFIQWAEENKLELPVQIDAPEAQETDTDKGKKGTTENRVRTGFSANYPPAYVSGQYPHKYFNPVKASTDVDAENIKTGKRGGAQGRAEHCGNFGLPFMYSTTGLLVTVSLICACASI